MTIMNTRHFQVIEGIMAKGLGTGDLFLTAEGLYFVLYDPGKDSRLLSNLNRPGDWAVQLGDRVRKWPRSFFLEKSAIAGHDFYTQKVQVVRQPSGLTSTHEDRIFRIMLMNGVHEFYCGAAPEVEKNLASYFQNKPVFDKAGFERHGLHIELLPPSIMIERMQAGDLGDKNSTEDFLKAAVDPAYMGAFSKLFREKVPADKRREAVEFMARRVPSKFTEAVAALWQAKVKELGSALGGLIFFLAVGIGLILLARALHHGQLLKGLIGITGLTIAGVCIFNIPLSLIQRRSY